MFKKFLNLSALAAVAQASSGSMTDPKDHWAVIMVGSRGYENYRHHADGCHAYHIAIQNGIPEDQVILIAYDDVAQSFSNPYKGKLFNKPTADGVAGVDVYEGCKIDYKGRKASKKTLLGVLQGDTQVGSKVLKSDENSKVFFYFADHGAPGLIGMPTGWFGQQYLHADELHKAVKFMHENKMYKEMVMYVEACESGSMFEKILEDNIGVYAVSAANSQESSWGTYCSPDDKVNGKHIGSCLGDLFSVNWMEDADVAKMGQETLKVQYETVQKKTTRSHVLQWGNLTIADEVIGEFESNGDYKVSNDWFEGLKQAASNIYNEQWTDKDTQRKNDFAVDQRDTRLHYLYRAALADPSHENQAALQKELNNRLTIDRLFKETNGQLLADIEAGKSGSVSHDFDCYRDLIENFERSCGKSDYYTMKYFKVFSAQCEVISKYAPAAEGMKSAMSAKCDELGLKPTQEIIEEDEL